MTDCSDLDAGVNRGFAGELEEYARVLERTGQAGLRWHLAVSWR